MPYKPVRRKYFSNHFLIYKVPFPNLQGTSRTYKFCKSYFCLRQCSFLYPLPSSSRLLRMRKSYFLTIQNEPLRSDDILCQQPLLFSFPVEGQGRSHFSLYSPLVKRQISALGPFPCTGPFQGTGKGLTVISTSSSGFCKI